MQEQRLIGKQIHNHQTEWAIARLTVPQAVTEKVDLISYKLCPELRSQKWPDKEAKSRKE
jgi:hypothetical protein